MKLAQKPKRKIRIVEGLKKYRQSMKEILSLVTLVGADPAVVEEGRIAVEKKVKALDRIIKAWEEGVPFQLERLAWVEKANREIEDFLENFEETHKEARILDLTQFTLPWVKL